MNTSGRLDMPPTTSGYQQHVYFNDDPKIICWADNAKNPNYGCDNRSETEIMLCAPHYREIFGDGQPKEKE